MRVITRGDGEVYLRRWFVCKDTGILKKLWPAEDQEPRWWQRLLTWLPHVYLHKFEASDGDEEVHNHPWSGKSLILAGGYVEFRAYKHAAVVGDGDAWGLRARFVGPWEVNDIREDTFHRVTLAGKDCWSIIVVGARTQSWGFLNPKTGEFLPWREHAARRAKRYGHSSIRGGET
jgi:hypothetical protein